MFTSPATDVADPARGSVAWELRSRQTSATACCVLEEDRSGIVVRVMHAGHLVSSSWHSNRTDALERAHSIRRLLLLDPTFPFY
jgi:hypothetical protein